MHQKILNILTAAFSNVIFSEDEKYEMSLNIYNELEDILELEKEQVNSDLNEYIKKLEKEILKLKKEKHFNCDPIFIDRKNTEILEYIKNNWNDIEILNIYSIKPKEVLDKFKKLNIQKRLDHKRIILAGKSASGKDYLRSLLVNIGFKPSVAYTTRPRREGECEGIDYYYISEKQFKKMISKDEFYEYVKFNDWYYGTSNEQFYSDDIFIMTPSGISKIHKEDKKNSLIFFLDIDLDIRKERIIKRNDIDCLNRRLAADEKDFKDFNDFDVVIKKDNFNNDDYISHIIKFYTNKY